ncbi:MAG: dihydrolipoyl dehydrogenase [Hyphomicrobium sp.]
MMYDLIVIGTGPGGYVAAIRAAQLGLKVAAVEKRSTHGGTCLNVGCIPSKALLHASEFFEEANTSFPEMGIKGNFKIDLKRLQAFKIQGVKSNVEGVSYLLKKNKIETFHGEAKIIGPGKVGVTFINRETSILETKNILIATGSEPIPLPGVTIDEKKIVTSTGALLFETPPKRLLVVGAGVIGLELGSVWKRLGSKVVVVEYLDRILPGMDGDIASSFQKILEKQGMEFRLGQKVNEIKKQGTAISVVMNSVGSSKNEKITTDAVLIAIGRKPYTQGLGLAEVGILTDSKGRIHINEHYKTNMEGVYAIGDVISGPMLAHKAEEEGVAFAERLAGQEGHVNYNVIPNVLYTAPEVASVGKTEEELKEEGVSYTLGKFPFTANGRAKINRTTDGFVKIIAHSETDRVLGVHIIGPHAGEMIAEASVLMEFGGSAEDLARICHAHPTLSEAVKEAALATGKRALHM